MSLPTYTLADARLRVDYHLRDRDAASEAFSLFEKNVAIASHVTLMGPRLLLGDQWNTSLASLVAGTDTYALPTTSAQQYDRLKKLRLRSSGMELPIVSLEVFEGARAGDSGGRGVPQVAMVIEGESHVPALRVWPIPNAADVVEGFFTLLPESLGQVDTAVIPFDAEAFEALCYEVALELYGKMPQDERDRRKLGPDTPATWTSLIGAGIRASRQRRRRQQGGQMTLSRRRW